MEEEIKNAEESIKAMHAEREQIESDGKELLACTEEIVSKMMEQEDELSSKY